MKLQAGLAFIVLALPAACQPASRDLTEAERAAIADSVKAAHHALFAAIPSRNVDSIMRFFSPPERLTWAENGMIFPDGDSLMRVIRTNLGRMRSIQLTSGEPRISVMNRGLAILTTTFEETATDSAGTAMHVRGAWTVVYVRAPDAWKITNAHESFASAPTGPAPSPPARRRG